ncbi:MAG: OpgC domain-containing protein [Pseudomonadota bacterium]
MNDRIIGIDIARAVAILLVTWKHSMASFQARGQLDGWSNFGLEFLMQLATPIFLVLFGAMLELVYRPRYERGLQHDITRRLIQRGLQCYGYYCLAIIIFFSVMGTYSAMSLPFVFTGFISVPYSHLLAFYTAALLLAPALIHARIRYGLAPLVCIAVLVHLLHPMVRQLPPAPEFFNRDYLQHMSGFLYGRGVDFIGPSLLHGLSLVCFGMLFGHGLHRRGSPSFERRLSVRVSVAMALAASLVIVIYLLIDPSQISLDGLIDAALRVDSHPVYFSIGILGALALTWLCIYTYDVKSIAMGRGIRVFGRRSLFAFGVGNILAYIAPLSLTNLFGLWGSVTLLFLTVCGLTLIYDRVERAAFFSSTADALTATVRRLRRLRV